MIEPNVSFNEEQLLTFLKNKTPPVLETTLLKEFFPRLNSIGINQLDLSIIQMHFLLYHKLYKLVQQLKGTSYLLHIQYIYIYLFTKPEQQLCPYFYKNRTHFCLSKKNEEDPLCTFHLKKEKDLNQQRSLMIQGIEEYYLDINNYRLLEQDYKKIVSQAEKIKEYAFRSSDLDRSFGVLGLQYGVSMDKVQNRYKILAKKYHPDINSSPEAQKKFVVITQAYNNVKDFIQV